MDPEQPTNGDSIQVVVRIKPGSQDDSVIYTHNEIKLDRHSFGFDRIFGPNAQQQDIFSAVGKKLLTHTLQGYNSCIFVYGQTGSGKTFTMMGNNNGMMQRSFNELFNRIDRMTDSQCIVTCSYFELYNEQIIDLLDRGKDKKTLNIRQDVKKGVFVENLTEESALNAEKLIECLMMGMKNRHIGETQMNRESSRSHSIFTISLAIKSEVDGKKVLKTPKLHFVDLAGSQRQKMTMATGDRLKEAGNINKSLTTLGMVINALASDRPKVHIPYRDSKLTCLLRDSLGGNSKTFIVATITTSMLCFQETLSTLNFANRAKMVKVKALVNEESLSTNIQQYKEEIRRLKQEIQKFKSDRRVNFQHHEENGISKSNSDLEHKFQLISSKIEDLRANMVNNSIETLYDRLQHQSTAMLDQNSTPDPTSQQQGKELLQFMSCNNDLLKKVQTTMFQYLQLKEQIKNVEFSKRMPMQQMRTPSKFQRDQYQDLLIKRQNHIKELQEKVVLLKELSYKREIELKDHKKRLAMSESNKMEEGEEMQRLREEGDEQGKRLAEIQVKYEMAEDEVKALKRQIEELQGRLKESKELYLYSQEKYQNERFIRGKLQSTVKDLNKKMHHLQTQRREATEQLTSTIELLQQKLLEGERRQEDLKSEQEILNESLEFSQRRLKEYGDRLQEANRVIGQSKEESRRLNEVIVWAEADAERKRREYEGVVDQMMKNIHELRDDKTRLESSLAEVRKQREDLHQLINEVKHQHSFEISELNQHISQLQLQKRLRQQQIQSLHSLHQSTLVDHTNKVQTYQKTIESLSEEILAFQRWKTDMQQRYQAQHLSWQSQKDKMATQLQRVQTQQEVTNLQLSQKHAKMLELQAFVNANRNIIEDHEQLKRTYKEIIKQNYRLKGEYHNTNELTRNQELVSKVAFYQQKFRLMSIEYNKVQETTKRLKQKEYSLMKKIEYYQENEKLKKIHTSSQAEEVKAENVKSLMLENQELKASLTKSKSMYESLLTNDKKEDYTKRLSIQNERYQLQQRQEKIKKRLESAIKNWDHAKENNCTGMSLDELFNCWTKIELESRKKFEGIVKAIKRQQKLKSQNHFILKENIFLKSQVQALEKELNMQALGNPRKLIKQNEEIVEVHLE